MSEEKMAPVADGRTEKSSQSVHGFQPIWMAHWMRPSNNAAAKRRERGNEELDCLSTGNNMKDGSKDSSPVKESRVIETKTFEVASSKCEENKTACWSCMKHGPITDAKQPLGQLLGHRIELDKAIDLRGKAWFSFGIPAVNEASFERCHSAGEGTSKNLPEWMDTHSSAIDRTITLLKPFREPIMEPSAHIMPYYGPQKGEFDKAQKEFNKGKAPLVMKPHMTSKNQFPNSEVKMLEQEHCYKHGQTADLFCERKTDSQLDTAMDVHFRDMKTSLLFDAPSTSHHHLPKLGRAWFQKMHNNSSCKMFPSRGTVSEKMESKEPCCSDGSLQKFPYCAHDRKTMRICATVDSMEATPEGLPRFSQTTHSGLIAKDVGLSKETDVFRATKFVTEMNRNKSNDIHSLSPFPGQGKRGAELQSLSGSHNSKGKRNIEDVIASKVTIKNESSAETDTMDMDLFKEENSNPGATHTHSIKDFNIDLPLSPRIDAASCGEVRHNWTKAVAPDINIELPALPSAAGSSKNALPTSSRTQSWDRDVGMLTAHDDHPNKNSDLYLGDSSKGDPTMRWVKRLKLRSPKSPSQGTKSSNLGKNSSPDEVKLYFKRILERGIASSEPIPRSHEYIETVMSDKSLGLSKANEDFMANSANKGKESLLSQAWIKRWLQNGSKVAKKKPVTVVCEPQSLKFMLDDFQKKQFPSIAAMALMGKAMNGLQSCELQKRDSFTVWNTKAF